MNDHILELIVWAYRQGWTDASDALEAASKVVNTEQLEARLRDAIAKLQPPTP